MATKKAHPICRAADFPPGERRIVCIDGRSIGVFNVKGTYYAIRNVCPHQRAPLCEGPITGTTVPGAVGEYQWSREGEIVRCPWHGWEFDITTGKSIVDPAKLRVARYDVDVQPGALQPPQPGGEASVPAYEVTVEDDIVTLHV
jgi:nitrite reductase (NADH) small subunit